MRVLTEKLIFKDYDFKLEIMRFILKFIRNTVITLAVIYGLLFALTTYAHYPEPISAIRLGLAPASKTPLLMPSHEFAPASKPISLPTGIEVMPKVDYQGNKIAFDDFLSLTKTNAFLVIRNGMLTYQYYNDGFSESSKLPSYSVAKTMTSLMIGKLIADGKISESDHFVDFFPELKNNTDFDKVTIRDLLDMQGGVLVSDNYPTGPSGWGVAIAQMYATTDTMWFIKNNRKMAEAPGTKADYRSVDSQMLGMIIRKVTGEKVSDYFSKNIWQKVGAKYPGTWNVDKVGGQEKTFCCFNATAIDYAKVGLMLLNNGYVGSERVVSADWMKRLRTPVVKLDRDWGYGAQIWHPYPDIMMMMGLHGQYVYVDPATRTVIVKSSDVPTGKEDEAAVASVLNQISKLRS